MAPHQVLMQRSRMHGALYPSSPYFSIAMCLTTEAPFLYFTSISKFSDTICKFRPVVIFVFVKNVAHRSRYMYKLSLYKMSQTAYCLISYCQQLETWL